MLRVLISNDDGVYAKGILALTNAIKKIADHVDVVAPDRNRSGASNSLTLTTPLQLKTLDNGFVSVEGTPTDCVHVAITGLLTTMPDMVVTGINAGSNLGDDVWYSGTVAAAMEGRFLGLPAIAMSLVSEKYLHYETAAKVACELIQHILQQPLPAATILNVNVPDVPFEELQGYEVTRLGTRHCAEPTIKEIDPRGHTVYWVGPPGTEQDAGVGTDFYAVRHNKVSITPLRIDLTHYEAFDVLSNWVKTLRHPA
ncbi:MAG TPA: 5'/3'-nucleotidase SurE [Coxiellaceae bacterium]|nr:MAG: 5'/3'-nucleotidase SurE [Gammaproteobacteria bacterium RIFCSPHIGHO2_12_FULL_36_30]HLB56287.1 5'/3'-nucleotidase SurE [Coxiellaceae bacterium]